MDNPNFPNFDQDAFTAGIKVLIYNKYRELSTLYPEDFREHYPNKEMLATIEKWIEDGYKGAIE